MSSLNESADYDDSIPLEDESYSDSYDYDYSGSYSTERNMDDEGSSVMDDSYVSERRIPVGSSSAASNNMNESTEIESPFSGDRDETNGQSLSRTQGSFTNSMYDEEYEGSTSYYSSGYENSLYDTTNSPRSGSMSSMGRTWATFYTENQFIQSARSFYTKYKRPIQFFSVCSVGGSLLRGCTRVMETFTFETASTKIVGPEVVAHLPVGYPISQLWMSEMRASLPWIPEKLARSTLRHFNIPVASELVDLGDNALLAKEGLSDWSFSGRDFSDIENTTVYATRDGGMSSPANSSIAPMRDPDSMPQDSATFATSQVYSESQSLKRTTPHTVPMDYAERDEAAASSEATKMTSIINEKAGSEPLKDTASNISKRSSNYNDNQQSQLDTSVGVQYALDGDVVGCIVGRPSVTEVNALLIACVKYGCATVLLPDTVSSAREDLVSVPPSVEVEYVADVVARGGELAIRRNLFLTAVCGEKLTDQGVLLSEYEHPKNAVYMFFAQSMLSDENIDRVTEILPLVQHQVYCGKETKNVSVVINECFYDRLLKERANE